MGDYRRMEYHEVEPFWRLSRHTPTGQLCGIELEVVNQRGYMKILSDLPDPPKGTPRPVTEEDSSLPYDTGVEIVFPPFKYSSIKNGNSFFSRAVKAIGAGGAGPGVNGGMHVNINTTEWGVKKRSLVCALVVGLTVNEIKAIGGRVPNHYCELPFNSLYETPSTLSIRTISTRCNFSHTVVSRHGNRLELRFPRSTTDLNKIRLVIDFADYIEKYADFLLSQHNTVYTRTVTEITGGPVGVKFVEYLKTLRQTAPVRRLIKEISNAR